MDLEYRSHYNILNNYIVAIVGRCAFCSFSFKNFASGVVLLNL